MSWQRFVLYFLWGGTLVSLITYLGAVGRGFWASFAAVFPAITVLTFYTVYKEGGFPAFYGYAKGLLILQPAWLAYVACVLWLLPRKGLAVALAAGVFIYVAGSLLIKRLFL